MIIIGVDCATKEDKTGLALGLVLGGKLEIQEVKTGSDESRVEVIARWLKKDSPALMAIDAPLGWPVNLARGLQNHQAGKLLKVSDSPVTREKELKDEADLLFSRKTDGVVSKAVWKGKKKPLEVGANLIARTAHTALRLLGELRKTTGLALPLAWEMGKVKESSVIEVYPAATLKALGISATGYKKVEAENERSKIIKHLTEDITIPTSQRGLLESDANALDAVVCVLAGWDFIQGKCLSPKDAGVDIKLAEKEGWIWFRNPLR